MVKADPLYFSVEVTSDSGLANKAWFQFSEEGEFGIDASDAYQFNPLSSHYVSLSSILNDTTKLDIGSLPFITEVIEIPLELKRSVCIYGNSIKSKGCAELKHRAKYCECCK